MAEQRYKQALAGMQELAEEYVNKLTEVWTETFDEQTCWDNLDRLYKHARDFYDDLVAESLQKKSFIQNEIIELKLEAENLQRLLKTNVQLPDEAENRVPLLVLQSEMDKRLSDLREQLRKRREQICDLLLEQETLCDELGEPTRPLLADPLPTAEELDHFRSYLDSLKEERLSRTQQLMTLRKEIKQNLEILEEVVSTEADDRLLNHRQIKLSKETFESLDKMREYFSEQVDKLKMSIDNIRQKLPYLWERLNMPVEERLKIVQNTEYNQTTYDYLYLELQRCEEMKRTNLKKYIQKIRLEIEIWWDKTLKSDLERSRFTHFTSQIYTDELLTLHEMELEDLKQYFETNEEIFKLFSDRKILWDRMTALEQKACDPARYNNRGGQLLKEEKERKTIASKLPKIEQQIKNLVLEYQEREHAPFLVQGEDILELMEGEWKKKRQDKEAISTARKNAVTPNAHGSNRSQISSASRTPLMQRTASTMGLCKTPSYSNLSSTKHTNLASSAQKRKLNSKEKTTPNAKRVLWTTPKDVFIKPKETVRSATKSNVMTAKSPNGRKKLPRVLASTIRRHSGRLSGNGSLKKRRSLNKSGGNSRKYNAKPQIIVTEPFSTDDENYDAFKQSIEPESRSSIHHDAALFKTFGQKSSTSTTRGEKHLRRQKLFAIQEHKQDQKRLATLPKPQIVRTPSKQSLRDYPVSPGVGTSSVLTSNRKLTTKNLPIII